MKYQRKCSDKYNRREVIQYSMKNVFKHQWSSAGEASRELGFDKSAILRCCKGRQKKHYWFIWRFKDDVDKELLMKQDESHSTTVSQTVHTVEGSGK